MRVLGVELKRILKSRRSILLMGIGVLLSVLLAIAPVMFVGFNVSDSKGNVVQELDGLKAIHYLRENRAPFDGEVTPDKLKEALSVYQKCVKQYGDPESEDFPGDIYQEKISPRYGLLSVILKTYTKIENGNLMPRSLDDIHGGELDHFYQATDTRLDNVMKVENEPKETHRKAFQLYGRVKRPFQLYEGYTRDAFDYLAFCIFFLVIISVVFSAPLFSDNYESGADQIIRCTKLGRKRLGIVKVIANLIPCILMYVLGVTMYLLVSDLSFGPVTLQSSVQALYDTVSLPNMNLLQLQITLAVSGLITMISTIALTYFISSKISRAAGVISLSLLLALGPVFTGAFSEKSWFVSMLPAGGVGFNTNLLYQLVDFRFLHLGTHSFWAPHVTMTFAIIWIPVFLTLTVYSYCKHQIK